MPRRITPAIAALLLWPFALSGEGPDAPALRVPEGFTVERAAGPGQVRFPMFAAFDDRGRLFVAESSGGDLYAELVAQTRNCRISLLEDRDGDGRFESSTVFADKLVFPMGVAWRDGKLYVPDPPDLVTLKDTDGDGRADRRTVLLTGFGHIDNGSLHGLTFGPDGMLYMTMGTPDGWKLKAADGSMIEGTSGALFRCNPDGSNVEVVARGFVNLVEVAFTPRGDIFGTDNWWQDPNEPGGGGMRDALVHIVEGGLYPYIPDTGTPLPTTGVALLYMELQPAVAFSGLCLHRGDLFAAQHNARIVSRHVLVPEGATFKTRESAFVTTSDPDFHPSDVLEAPDGSLLVVDTGSWYIHHCPTGVIRHSPATGGIYRVRAARPAEVAPLKEDDRVIAAIRALTSGRDRPTEHRLVQLLGEGNAAVRLAAAEALARSGSVASLPTLWRALENVGDDRFLGHALIHALHKLADREALLAALDRPHPRVRKAALLLLDQPPHPPGSMPLDAVMRSVSSDDEPLRLAALGTLAKHPEWAEPTLSLLRQWLEKPALLPEEQATIEGCLLAFQSLPGAQELLAEMVAGEEKLLALGVMAQTHLPDVPSTWPDALRRAVESDDAEARLHAVRTASALGVVTLDDLLERLALDQGQSAELRLESVRALLPRRDRLFDEHFTFLLERLDRDANPLHKLTAVELLRQSRLTDAQALRVLHAVRDDPQVAPTLVLAVFRRPMDDSTAAAVLDYLAGASRTGPPLPEPELAALAEHLPPSTRSRARSLSDQQAQVVARQRARLTDLEPLLSGGDPVRGQEVFFSAKSLCATCHRVGPRGGQVGPDLTKIGAIRAGRDLLESIALPSATLAQGFDYYVATTTDGRTLSGVLRDRTADGMTLRDATGGQVRLRTGQVKSLNRLPTSIMPEGLDRILSPDELRDLLAYLQRLK